MGGVIPVDAIIMIIIIRITMTMTMTMKIITIMITGNLSASEKLLIYMQQMLTNMKFESPA